MAMAETLEASSLANMSVEDMAAEARLQRHEAQLLFEDIIEDVDDSIAGGLEQPVRGLRIRATPRAPRAAARSLAMAHEHVGESDAPRHAIETVVNPCATVGPGGETGHGVTNHGHIKS